MKKVIISFILLLICGGVAFFFGYILIPQDQYAIINTTLFGFDEKVYPPQTFMWRWEKLLPTVFNLYTFHLAPYTAEIESPMKGSLYPSGNDYAKGLGENFDFSFEISLSLKFGIIPDKLLDLVKNGLRPENLESWYKDMTMTISESLFRIITDNPEIFVKLTRKEYITRIQDILGDNKEFDGITILDINPKKINIPDYDAYRAIKAAYLKHLEFQTTLNNEKIMAENKLYLEAIQKEIEIIRNIEKYGEILTKYPAILDYLHKANKEYIEESMKQPLQLQPQ